MFQVDAEQSAIACEQELRIPDHSSLTFADQDLQVIIGMADADYN